MTYARLSVIEPHRNGYSHIHDALFVEDPKDVVCDVDVLPALDSHLTAVAQAQPRNHGPDAVDVRPSPDRKRLSGDPADAPPITPLSREVTKLLGGLAPHDEDEDRNPNVPNVLQAKRGRIRFYALLWATGIPQWRPDRDTFQMLVKASQELFGTIEDVEEGYADPVDVDTKPRGSSATVKVNEREVAFERINAEDALDA